MSKLIMKEVLCKDRYKKEYKPKRNSSL